MKALAQGICSNKTLKSLSLSFCGIDEKGADSLFQVIIYQSSLIQEMDLSGNKLGDKGAILLFQGLSCARSLEKISLADNGINQTKEVLDSIQVAWHKNTKLKKYDLKHNNITDDGVDRLCLILEDPGCQVFECQISEWINEDTLTKFNAALASKKPKKGKKGKKK